MNQNLYLLKESYSNENDEWRTPLLLLTRLSWHTDCCSHKHCRPLTVTPCSNPGKLFSTDRRYRSDAMQPPARKTPRAEHQTYKRTIFLVSHQGATFHPTPEKEISHTDNTRALRFLCGKLGHSTTTTTTTTTTSWSRSLPKNLTVPRLVRKFPEFYGTRRFITAFTRARHCIKGSVRFRDFCKWFVTSLGFCGEKPFTLRINPSWNTTPCRLSATANSIYSQLPCTSGGRSSIRNPRTRHAVVTESHLSLGQAVYIIHLLIISSLGAESFVFQFAIQKCKY